MSVVVQYPIKISSYYLTLSGDSAHVRLIGTGQSENGSLDETINAADMEFKEIPSDGLLPEAFTNRGGFLNITYRLSMLPAVLTVLDQGMDVILLQDGKLTTRDT